MNKSTDYRVYKNDEIEIHWDRKYCNHAAECFSRLLSVFDPGKRPWVNPYGATTDEIIDTIMQCPTPALTFRWLDEAKNETDTSPKLRHAPAPQQTVDQPTSIVIRPNGPILVSGNFEIVDSDGQKLPTLKMASLCRCGESGIMPFCDGTHFKIRFRD